jgi:hypothetical protein
MWWYQANGSPATRPVSLVGEPRTATGAGPGTCRLLCLRLPSGRSGVKPTVHGVAGREEPNSPPPRRRRRVRHPLRSAKDALAGRRGSAGRALVTQSPRWPVARCI